MQIVNRNFPYQSREVPARLSLQRLVQPKQAEIRVLLRALLLSLIILFLMAF